MKKLSFLLLGIFLVGSSYAPPPGDLTTIIIDGVNCGPHGTAKENTKEFDSNVFKNRFDIPQASDFDKTIGLDKIVVAKKDQAGFNPSKAVDIEGFIVDVKPGGKETCNCKTTDPAFKDTHIEIVTNQDETGKDKRVIVEVTPRLRQIMAGQGEDWSTDNLKGTLVNRFVHIQGWLFYDISHEKENFADDPDDDIGIKNWRATSWELHPVTSIEVLSDPSEGVGGGSVNAGTINDEDNSSPAGPVPLSTSERKSNANKNNSAMNTHQTPSDILILIILGAILGTVGQGIRVMVGLKKMRDVADSVNVSTNDLYQASRVIMSLLIACAIGVIAGVLAAVTNLNATIDKTLIIAFISAGYAGTDFIEGFMRKEGAPITKAEGTVEKGTSPV